MIEIVRTGYCEGCKYLDIDVNCITGNGEIVELFASCKHGRACKRAYDLGVLDACRQRRKTNDRDT